VVQCQKMIHATTMTCGNLVCSDLLRVARHCVATSMQDIVTRWHRQVVYRHVNGDGRCFILSCGIWWLCVWFSWLSSGGCAEVGVLEVVELHYIPFRWKYKKWIYDMVSSGSKAPTCCGFFQCAESKVWSLKADGACPPCVVFPWCRPWSRLVDSKSSGILSSG